MNKKVYFVGIAGKAMGPLAKAFRDSGWNVSGSDHVGIYPPISTYLAENNIPYIEGYTAKNVPHDADLIVVGRSALMVDPDNPEYTAAKKIGCPILSYPEVLSKYLIKENSIVVAGTYGKTTISAIVAWILITAGLNPSYMTGGIPLNMGDGVKMTDSKYSVVEGDEPPALLETDLPKFMFYKPKYLVVTATKHDHPEIFKTQESYTKAFKSLVGLLPKNGKLIFNSENVDLKVVENFAGERVSYSLGKKADYFVKNISANKGITRFTLDGRHKIELETVLIGKHNLEDICAAAALCLEIGVDEKIVKKAIGSFSGIKARLEFFRKSGGRFIYWDLAQHPAKIKGTLDALREHYLDSKIFCVFDPAMTGLKYKESLVWYPGAFNKADSIVVGKVGYLRGLKGENRVSGADIVKAISQTQKNVFYEPVDERILKHLIENTKPGDVIVFMSSGGLRFTDLIQETIKKLIN